MATDSPSTGDTFKIFYEGEWHELIVRTRQSHAGASAEKLAQLTTKTIGLWLRVWQAYKHDIWALDGDSAEQIVGAESGDFEPFVTVFNKTFTGISITVHSSSKGQAVLNTLMAILFARDDIAEKMPQLFNPDTQNAPKTPPKEAKKNIDNVDDFIPPYSGGNATQSGTTQVKAFVRPATLGSIPNTLKLQKGAKDKQTWEMAIAPTKPYSANSDEFQEKDLLVYPITGAIRYEGSSTGFYFAIPVPDSEIRIYQREATNFDGKSIESDSMKLIKHLGLTGELTQGMKWDVPASHVAMKVGKLGDKGRFRNYVGLYKLEQ